MWSEVGILELYGIFFLKNFCLKFDFSIDFVVRNVIINVQKWGLIP